VRESLFAVLGDLDGVRVLDLYSGSGALGIEALSRGAASAVCVEHNRQALDAIKDNRDSLGLQAQLTIVPRRVEDALKHLTGPFDLVLADPPWADLARAGRELALLLVAPGLVESEGLIVVEHSSRDQPPKLPATFEETRVWGDTAASFYRAP
jgi:16S rRNA (guanine966-N2)-methyltransferase